MKLFAVVIAYNPNLVRLRDNISRFARYVEEVVIWDNSNTFFNNIENTSKITSAQLNIRILGCDQNVFIAEALNQTIEYGIKQGYTHILTMDQDSLFYKNSFATYISQINQYPNFIDNGYSFCPRVIDETVYRNTIEPQNKIYQKDKTITSGTIYCLKSLKKLGGFRRDYKIDYVDFEMSTRLNIAGYYTICCEMGILLQTYGDTRKQNNCYTLNYSPIRLYYQTRNRTIFRKEYPTTSRTASNLSVNIRLIPKILLYEDNKLKKVFAIVKGWIDGLIFKTHNHEKSL